MVGIHVELEGGYQYPPGSISYPTIDIHIYYSYPTSSKDVWLPFQLKFCLNHYGIY